jgi:hypothetical protein
VAGVVSRSFESPDEVRTPSMATVDVVDVGGIEVGRFTFQPGWRWRESIQPIVGTDNCEAEHLGYVISGRLAISHQDGTELMLGPGDTYLITPGHDAWVDGDEPFVAVEFKSAGTYARG